MVKKISISILCISLMIFFSACTRNNGDIGPLFGNWRVETLSADGEDMPLYEGDVLLYTWSFQSHIIVINSILPHDDADAVRGTWSITDKELLLDFDHTDIDGSLNYTPPPALHLDGGAVNRLAILKYTSSELMLERSGVDGIKYVYHLKKAY